MTINLQDPDIRELKPRITVFGVGGAGGNAVNNMITAGPAGRRVRRRQHRRAGADACRRPSASSRWASQVTEGLGAGSQPEVGRAAAEEVHRRDPRSPRRRAHGVRHRRHGRRHRHRRGAGRSPAPPASRASSPSASSPSRSTSKASAACASPKPASTSCRRRVDTLIVIPNQNLFRVANEKTTFADAFAMADQVLYSGVACITDLMVKEGLINLDFADVRAVMREMGKAMMGTGEASGEKRALTRRRSGDRQSAARRGLDEGRQGPADLDHRRQRPDAVRSRRGGDPHPRGSRPGRQHHPRRDLRREPRRRHPRVGRRDRHRQVALGQTEASESPAVTQPDTRLAELAQRLRADTQRMPNRSAVPIRDPAFASRSSGRAGRSPAAAPVQASLPIQLRPNRQRRRPSLRP